MSKFEKIFALQNIQECIFYKIIRKKFPVNVGTMF